jgi:hypothetical protein
MLCNRESRFLDFLDFQDLTTEFGLAKEFYDQSRKGVSFIFMSSCPEMSFFGLKKENNLLIKVKKVFSSNGVDMSIKKSII